MNENTLWACFWVAVAFTIVGITVTAGYISTTEFKAAAAAGLQQAVTSNNIIIWVKP